MSSPASFINNEWVDSVDKKSFEVVNPSTEEVICSVSEATEKDVDIAVAAARKAFEGEWRKVAPKERGAMLNKLADIAEKNSELLAAVESLDNGKAIMMARNDVAMSIDTLRYYAGWADKVEGKTIDVNPDTFTYTRPEPVRRIGPPVVRYHILTAVFRSASAPRSSPGTSPCSCCRGRSPPLWPRATPSS